jgi:hypothetical protein
VWAAACPGGIATSCSWRTRQSWIEHAGIQAHAGNGDYQRHTTRVPQELQHSRRPIGDPPRRRPGIRPETCTIYLPGPPSVMGLLHRAWFSRSLRWSQHSHKRQGPDTASPQDRVRSISDIQRTPWVFTHNSLRERSGSQETPPAAICQSHRQSMPSITGSFPATHRRTSATSIGRLRFRLDQVARPGMQ